MSSTPPLQADANSASVALPCARNPQPIEGEEWRPIPGFENYEASDLGRIRSIPRTMPLRSRAGYMTERYYHSRILAGIVHYNGYRTVNIKADVDDKNRHYCVNRLVFAAFVRPPRADEEVDHINRVRDDNRPLNLRALSVAENRALRVCPSGEQHWSAKLTASDVDAIRSMVGTAKHSDIGARFGVSRSLISMIASGRVWKDAA